MDTAIKIGIFLAVFGLLLVIGRMLSTWGEVHASTLPRPSRPPEVAAEERRGPALVGSEIEFPIQIPPIQRLRNGIFNRPIIKNYYLAKTDLVHGPEDAACFVDEFTLQVQDPGSEDRWQYQYTVATPAGLRQYLEEKHFDSLYFESKVVIVARWDLGMILQTVIDQIMHDNASEDEGRGQTAPTQGQADDSEQRE